MDAIDDREGDDDPDEMTEILKRHTAMLMEHCEAVQIFVTRSNREHTNSHCWGGGNVHARNGQVRQWLLQQDEFVRVAARGQAASGDD